MNDEQFRELEQQYPPICSLCRAATMIIEAHFEPHLVEKLSVSIGDSELLLDGEIGQTNGQASSNGTDSNGTGSNGTGNNGKKFHRSIALRKDLQLTRPRVVLKGDTLTIALKIKGENPRLSKSPSDVFQRLPIIRIA